MLGVHYPLSFHSRSVPKLPAVRQGLLQDEVLATDCLDLTTTTILVPYKASYSKSAWLTWPELPSFILHHA